MISTLTTAQKTALDQMSRNFGSAYTGGFSQFMADLLATVGSGAIGIQSDARDIDSLALGGGAFTQDADNTSGLTFAFKAGRLHNGLIVVNTAAGTVALSASSTNYIEVDRSGTVSANTTGWTSGRMPLYVATTGTAAISAVTNAKPMLELIGSNGVTGAMLSSAAGGRRVSAHNLAISAATNILFEVPVTGAVSAVGFATTATIAGDDTNYWTWTLTNKGAAGTGTQALLAASAANTTKATGGSAMAPYVRRGLTLTTLTVGTELNVTAGDILVLTLTPTGSPTAIAAGEATIGFSFTG